MVGDGIWDARTCRKVGIPFIGIASASKAERLTAEGACAVLADFQSLANFELSLAKAIASSQAARSALHFDHGFRQEAKGDVVRSFEKTIEPSRED